MDYRKKCFGAMRNTWQWVTATLCFTIMCFALAASAKTLEVGSGQTYTDIASALAAAESGDTVSVRPGTYEISKLKPGSGVALVGQAGPLQTRLYAVDGEQAIIVEDVTDVRIEGFNIYAKQDEGPATNALVSFFNTSNVYLGNCFIHDAPVDGDVIKFNNTQDAVIESCVIWNPSERTKNPGTFQECIDIRGQGDARITVRGSWLYHEGARGDYLIYAKGGTTDLLWENNIFGPSAGEGSKNVPVETGHLVKTDDTPYESENFVVRNSLFVGLRGPAAFAFAGPRVSWLYNNVFYHNDDLDRALIEISANPATAGGPALKLFSLNNIFFDNNSKPIYRVRDVASAANLTRDYNLYQTDAQGGDLSLEDEQHSKYTSDVEFVAPTVPSFDITQGTEQIAEVLQGFRTVAGSSAQGAGLDPWDFAAEDHPDAIVEMGSRIDACGATRPTGGAWDNGLCQIAQSISTSDAGTDAQLPNSDGGMSGDSDTSTSGDGTSGDGTIGDDASTSSNASDGCACVVEATRQKSSMPQPELYLLSVFAVAWFIRRRRRLR